MKCQEFDSHYLLTDVRPATCKCILKSLSKIWKLWPSYGVHHNRSSYYTLIRTCLSLIHLHLLFIEDKKKKEKACENEWKRKVIKWKRELLSRRGWRRGAIPWECWSVYWGDPIEKDIVVSFSNPKEKPPNLLRFCYTQAASICLNWLGFFFSPFFIDKD